jgi:tetratricopeptide (TPR) repeat protein
MVRLLYDTCSGCKGGNSVAVDRSTTIQNAQRFMARGQIDKAIEEWQKLVSLTPQDGNLYNTIGDLYLKKNDTHHAIETFLLAATAFERAGFALKTIAVYKKILKVDPSCLEVNLKLADLNAERGLTGNAIEDYLRVAKEYGRKGKIQEALEIYRKIANFDPSNTNIRLKLAELSFREKLVDEAIDEYLKVAQIYAQNNRHDDAVAVYKKILEINPKHAAAREALKSSVTPEAPTLPTIPEIEEAMQAEDWGLAGQKVGILLLHEPANLTLRQLRGRILLHQEKIDVAWSDYRAVIDEAVRVGRPDQAIERVQEYCSLAPAESEAAEVLARLLDEAGRVDEAVRAYAVLIDLTKPDGTDADEAQEYFQRMKALDPTGETLTRYRSRFEAEPPSEPEPSASVAKLDRPDQVEAASVDAVMAAEREPSLNGAASSPIPINEAEPQSEMEEPLVPQADEVLAPAAAQVTPPAMDPVLSHEPVARKTSPVVEVGSVPPAVELVKPAEVAAASASVMPQSEASASRSRRETSAPSQSARPTTKRIRPKDLPDYFAEAEVYLKYGLAGKAIEQYVLILSVEANNIEAHSRLRELYQLEGRIDEAVTHSIALARLYHARGQRDEAEQVWAEAREWNPSDSRLQSGLTEQIAAQAGGHEPPRTEQPPAAGPVDLMGIERVEATVQRPKQDLQEWLAEAEFYLQQGLHEQAHQLFETIRRHYPEAPEVLAYFESHQPTAVPHAGAAPSPPPTADDPMLAGPGLDELADVLNRSATGNESGLDDASLSMELAEMFPGAFRGMDPPPAATDRFTASVEGVIRGVEQGSQPLPPEGPDPHYSLGLAYKEMGLYADARKEFERALSLPVHRIDAVLMIAACYQAEGQHQSGLRQLEECLASLPEGDAQWIKVVYELGMLHAQAGEPEKAISALNRLLAIDAAYEPAVALLKELQPHPAPQQASGRADSKRPPDEDSNPADRSAAAAKTRKDQKAEKRRRISYV